SLSWLGVVRLRQDDNNGGCFALTPLGAWLCGRSGSNGPALPAETSLAISANGEVIVKWPEGPAVADLYRFARRVQTGSGAVYLIEAGTIAMAIRQGLSAGGIIELLGRHGPVPQELVHSIRAWASAVQRMRVRRAVLLEATDAKALATLLALPQYRGLRLRRLTDTVAVVGDEERFWASLERLGRDGFLVESPGGTLHDDAL
ncbi:MAG: helicase-associated domain-containing protein, partial [Chloroflexota bacterium]